MTLPHIQNTPLQHDSSEAINLSNKDLADHTSTDKTGSRQTTPFAGSHTQTFSSKDPYKRWIRNADGTWINEARATSLDSFSQVAVPSQEAGDQQIEALSSPLDEQFKQVI